ncbi:TPA: transposase [Salmonella enterica subsp. enterica serovar Muenchen]|nr:transposase [Salmonella enterica subsp. enterica serovar Muenchen]HEC8861198.1 transposase [Salmonella enterica subsp. enterica serovar Muenchen]
MSGADGGIRNRYEGQFPIISFGGDDSISDLCWINCSLPERSALNDLLKRRTWPSLVRILEDGRVLMDNNRAARAIRPMGMGAQTRGSGRRRKSCATHGSAGNSENKRSGVAGMADRYVLKRLPSLPGDLRDE